ncbi:24570_t:CDS:2 [Cetraspora pellucida]|uniref:24570_t:CDS:1 n=1 Tax=Cetraspora pellucida TaxID=1433469 RepID=A0A9N9FSN8_9GLOM|nr:24570_t:CDS:2 [Cetraspora pellucida]
MCEKLLKTQDEPENKDDYLININKAYINEVTIIDNINEDIYKAIEGYKNNWKN